MTDKPKTIQEALAEVQYRINQEKAERITKIAEIAEEFIDEEGVLDENAFLKAVGQRIGSWVGGKAQTVKSAATNVQRGIQTGATGGAGPTSTGGGTRLVGAVKKGSATTNQTAAQAVQKGQFIQHSAGKTGEFIGRNPGKTALGVAAGGAAVGAAGMNAVGGGNKTPKAAADTSKETPKPATTPSPRASEIVASRAAGVPDARTSTRAPVQAAKGEGKTGTALAGLGVSKGDRRSDKFVKDTLGADFKHKAGTAEANLALQKHFQGKADAAKTAEKASSYSTYKSPDQLKASAAPAPAAETPKAAPAPAVAAPAKAPETPKAPEPPSEEKESGGKKGKKLKESALIDAFFKLHSVQAGNIFEAAKKLTPAQDKHLDVVDDDKIDEKDFAALRARKKKIKEQVEFTEEELAYFEAVIAKKDMKGKERAIGDTVDDANLTDETVTEEEAVKRGRGRPAGSKSGKEGMTEPKNLVAQNPRTYNKNGKNVVDLQHPTTGEMRTVHAKGYDDFRSGYLNTQKPDDKQKMHDSYVKQVFN
jgi:hypothetical protein